MAEPSAKARIALLMATRDQADLLHHALSSLFAQSHDHFTLTVVDDGSQDRTPEVLANLADPRMQVIRTNPQGFIPSLNLAMQKSRPAAFYAVVYASCFYDFHFLLAMHKDLQRHPQASGMFCCFCEGRSNQVGAMFQEPVYDNNELLVRNPLGPGVMFRGESFRLSGGLFLSERKGIWETWQRMSQHGPFEKHSETLLRWTPHAYDMNPPAPVLDAEKELFPHLKVQIQLLPGDTVDGIWLNLLKDAGHVLGAIEQLKTRPQLVLCGSPAHLPEAFQQAQQSYAPVMLLLNEIEAVKALVEQPRLKFLLASCTIATRTLKAAQLLKQYGHQALVYMPGMTKRETNRLLTRVPLLLYRHRIVLMIRAFGGPAGLQKTLDAIRHLNRPPEFGDLLIYCVDQHPQLIQWLKASPYAWQMAQRHNYFPELLFLLRQLKASHVLSLDAGVIPAADYFTQLWPLLADPSVGMAAGHLNQGPGLQAIHLPARHPMELMYAWPDYHPKRPLEEVDMLSDSAFLIRKPVLEWMLETHPETMPLGDETLFSKLLIKSGFRCILNRKTLAFNLIHTI